ncbi:MAG: hypothetical protein GT589_06675 [Peptoclostridium sp.]|uniref:S-layer homology domain-containing protein n=1 Tax=Peptoclostridium sp. TaxID=1904860 RepID=UPI00139EED3F|nr:S-layer homology domain-containing protein [Peptoclostridium sp.]MZQ75831.1 hypothetical protein [Peptoclostridium sp.]
MKTKKLIALTVSALMATTAFAPSAFAAPKNVNVNKTFAISNISFNDVDDVPWAKNSISNMAQKGILKGYGNGIFQPNKPVTQLEAIITALRVTGEEVEAVSYKELIENGSKNFKFKDLVSSWAQGYVELALDEEIINDEDVKNLNSAAKRYEVAKYMVRALDLEDEAIESMDEDIDFEDADSIPDGYEGYIYVAVDRGIMNGYPNGMFLPNKPVTRAEMSVLLERIDEDGNIIDDEDDIDDNEKYEGEVVSIDSDKITLSIDDEDETFDIDEDVEVVFENNAEGNIDDIEEGDEVEITVNEDEDVIKIEVDDELAELDTYNGRVLAIDEDEVTLLVGSNEKKYDIYEDVEVIFEDEEDGTVDDVIKGDKVKISVDEDDMVVKIELSRELEDFDNYEGEVDAVNEDEITIIDGSEDLTFDIDNDVQVFFNDDEMGDVEDIDTGDDVELIVDEADEVVTIIVDKDL